MPYIDASTRRQIDGGVQARTAGQLNYQISSLCKKYLDFYGICYDHLNEVIGVLECVKQELYRRVVVPYEDKKIKENGDVY